MYQRDISRCADGLSRVPTRAARFRRRGLLLLPAPRFSACLVGAGFVLCLLRITCGRLSGVASGRPVRSVVGRPRPNLNLRRFPGPGAAPPGARGPMWRFPWGQTRAVEVNLSAPGFFFFFLDLFSLPTRCPRCCSSSVPAELQQSNGPRQALSTSTSNL